MKTQRKIIDKFIDPILTDAIAKNKASGGASRLKIGEREVKDGETLLDHLVNYTEGEKDLVLLEPHTYIWRNQTPTSSRMKL